MANTAAIRSYLAENAAEYDPRKYLGAGRDAVKRSVQAKIREFGSNGKAN